MRRTKFELTFYVLHDKAKWETRSDENEDGIRETECR